MGYRLEAHIDDMSRSEAFALVRAILDKHGSDLVHEAIKKREFEIERRPPNDVAMAT